MPKLKSDYFLRFQGAGQKIFLTKIRARNFFSKKSQAPQEYQMKWSKPNHSGQIREIIHEMSKILPDNAKRWFIFYFNSDWSLRFFLSQNLGQIPNLKKYQYFYCPHDFWTETCWKAFNKFTFHNTLPFVFKTKNWNIILDAIASLEISEFYKKWHDM